MLHTRPAPQTLVSLTPTFMWVLMVAEELQLFLTVSHAPGGDHWFQSHPAHIRPL